jgi:nitrite reductase/ring-hydroxylating ferredoxin subunit
MANEQSENASNHKKKRRGKPKKSLQRYFDAEHGIRNHWWPALFSKELEEDDVQGITIAGERIGLRRANGKVYAFRDQCVHRGVRLSAQPTCLTKDTVSCWYHGFTYKLEDGKLCDIVASANDPLIGRTGIRVFPAEEMGDVIFVFVGDEDFDTPPLLDDLPSYPDDRPRTHSPRLQDENALTLGIHRKCVGDWRLAAESGGDPGHIMIHRKSALVLALDTALSLGEPVTGEGSLFINDKSWPKSVTKYNDNIEPVMHREELNIHTYGQRPPEGLRVSLCLPSTLFVENWPLPGITQYEWYVPVEKGYHEYWQLLVKDCPTEMEREDFTLRYNVVWEDLALKQGFNDDDIFAREAQEDFYNNRNGWDEEQLFSMDKFVLEYRKLVHNHARGIQPPPNEL